MTKTLLKQEQNAKMIQYSNEKHCSIKMWLHCLHIIRQSWTTASKRSSESTWSNFHTSAPPAVFIKMQWSGNQESFGQSTLTLVVHSLITTLFFLIKPSLPCLIFTSEMGIISSELIPISKCAPVMGHNLAYCECSSRGTQVITINWDPNLCVCAIW